jgi:hypothetical protein
MTHSNGWAQGFAPGPGVVPQATSCAYAFSTGAGATAFNWCLTVNGNLTKFETPAGENHSAPEEFLGEGYGVCSASGAHGVDWGNWEPVPFGPPVVVAGCTSGKSCTIQRDTTDGAFRLLQKFTQNTKELELNIDHTLTNIGAVTRTSVVLTRVMHFYVKGDADDRGDTSRRSAWLRDEDAIASTASTLKESASTFIIDGFMPDCNAAPNALPTPTDPGDLGNVITYNLGTLAPGKKKIVRVQIRRQ